MSEGTREMIDPPCPPPLGEARMSATVHIFPLYRNARLVGRLAEGVHRRRGGAAAAVWLDRELGRFAIPLLDAGVPAKVVSHEMLQLTNQVGWLLKEQAEEAQAQYEAEGSGAA